MKIGHDFELSKEFQDAETFDIGGYKIISHIDFGVMIQGLKLINLFDLAIYPVGILAMDADMQRQIEEHPFDIEEHHLVYRVSYDNYAWYFNSKQDAFVLLDLILQVKERALHDKFIRDSSVDITITTRD